MDDANPMRDKAARDDLRERVMDGIAHLEDMLSRLWTWATTYGESLCPRRRADTFGEGMREAKEQVSRLLVPYMHIIQSARSAVAGTDERCSMPVNEQPAHIASRYRMLTTEQQEYVSGVLNSAARRCMVNAEKARQDAASRAEPFGKHRGVKALEHASNAGALNIVDLLLVTLGHSGGPVPPSLIPAICSNCDGHGRLPCPCLPEKYEDVAELVGKPNCGNCRGDGDALCLRCFGRGALLSVMGPNEAKGVQIEETELARMKQDWHLDGERVAEARQEQQRLRDALIFISQQFCQRTDRADVRVCPETGDCLTEWCLPCYAGAIVNHDGES